MMRTLVDPKTRRFFVDWIDKIKDKLSLPIADIHETSIYWNDKYTVDNGIMGSFSIMEPNCIDLNPLGKSVPERIIPTIVHELRHRWQFYHNPVLYLFKSIPIIRNYTIEITAYDLESEADVLIEKY